MSLHGGHKQRFVLFTLVLTSRVSNQVVAPSMTVSITVGALHLKPLVAIRSDVPERGIFAPCLQAPGDRDVRSKRIEGRKEQGKNFG